MSEASIALVAIVIAAFIYIFCRIAADWLDERLASLPPESKAVMAGVLSFLLWYGVYCIRNSFGTLRSYGRTMWLVPLFLLLFALFLWQATRG
ncbi:MAG: hypothetical protein H5T64_07230 [Chloroflexi bacterium]|nr:hypothetical protein [Chloroflexota bacterium]